MQRRRLAVRILGIAATVHGFAYALTEGPGCLVDVNIRRKRVDRADIAEVLLTLVESARPLFVAFGATKSKRGTRASILDERLTDVCEKCDVMILRITAKQIELLTNQQKPTQWEVAHSVAQHFSEISHRLPRQPTAWQPDDNRLGMFQAVAVSLAAWQLFRPPPIDDS